MLREEDIDIQLAIHYKVRFGFSDGMLCKIRHANYFCEICMLRIT